MRVWRNGSRDRLFKIGTVYRNLDQIGSDSPTKSVPRKGVPVRIRVPVQ